MEKRSSSSAETHRAPAFTCEVCKISVRSSQKLMDHVKFSPLHQASLGLGKSSKGGKQMRQLLYDGSELFWRVNETLDLCIFEDRGTNCVTIQAFEQAAPQELSDNKKKKDATTTIPALEVDLSRLRQTLGLEAHLKKPGFKMGILSNSTLATREKATSRSPALEHSSALITKYLLARLQARRDSDGRLSLFLQKINNDDVDPGDLQLTRAGGCQVVPTDLVIRRRHTIDDVKDAQDAVSVATTRLKNARIKAEELSNLTRMTLDALPHTKNDATESQMIT